MMEEYLYIMPNIFSPSLVFFPLQCPESPSLVKVDAANGVGGASMRKVMGGVRGEWLKVEIYNDGSGILNDQVRRLYVAQLSTWAGLHRNVVLKEILV